MGFFLQAVTGIVLPERSNKLYSGSSDGTVRLWDCHSGQCASVINLGGEVRSIICEGPWVFVGMLNVVKVSVILNYVSIFSFSYCCHLILVCLV